MKLKSSVLLTPFFIAYFDYDLYSIFSIFFIFLIYFDQIKVSINKIILKVLVSLFFIFRFLSSLFPNFDQVWINISQKNYALKQKYIDIESVFTAFSCNFLGAGSYSFSNNTYSINCPHTVSYGPFFEIIGFKNNPIISKYIFSFFVFSLILIYYFNILKSLNLKYSYIFSLSLLSPPVNFLLERMNFDIFIFISIYVIYNHISKESYRSLIIFFLALMKYYPIFLLAGSVVRNVINKKYKQLKINFIYLGIYFYSFLYLYFSESNILAQPVRPLRPDRTFGILSDALNLRNLFVTDINLVYISLLVLISFITFILRSKVQTHSLVSKDMDHDLIVMFLTISLFANYDYRLAFLILLLPSIIKTENKILNLSFLLFIFSSPGLMHSYGDLFQLVENYQFAYIDFSFYTFVACLFAVYINYLINSLEFLRKKNK